jgi:hypothetical protein
MNGILSSKRTPISLEHQHYNCSKADADLYGEGVIHQEFKAATVTWLCRNQDLRDEFLLVCASVNNSIKRYTSTYAENFELHQNVSPIRRYPMSNNPIFPALEWLTKRHHPAESPPTDLHPHIITSSVRVNTNEMMNPINHERELPISLQCIDQRPTTAADANFATRRPQSHLRERPRSSMREDYLLTFQSQSRGVPWPTFKFSINGLKTEHQEAFGHPHADHVVHSKENILLAANCPTAVTGRCSPFFDPDIARIEADTERIKLRPSFTQRINNKQQQHKLPLSHLELVDDDSMMLKQLLPTNHQMPSGAKRHERNPMCKKTDVWNVPYDCQAPGYTKGAFQTTYNTELGRRRTGRDAKLVIASSSPSVSAV